MRFTVIMMNKLRFDAKGSNMRYRFLWKVFSVSFFFFFFFLAEYSYSVRRKKKYVIKSFEKSQKEL